MYTLKSIAKRGALLGAAGALLVATFLPAVSTFADALNPLTERSLLLSSSAPGYTNTDGAGNSSDALNSYGENYAPAGSGPNGRKTGETFSFKVSSDATIKAFGLQYCTLAAGYCRAPGNNTGDADPDRNHLATGTNTRQLNDPSGWAAGTSDFDITGDANVFAQGTGAGEFQIFVATALAPTVFNAVSASDWEMAVSNNESTDYENDEDPLYDNLTGTNNYAILSSATGQSLENGDTVKIVFNPSETTFITNPGAGAFFVKMNTYNTDTAIDIVPGGVHNVDGGVTVANVMTDSIHITTKVLETMAFSVGTRNRDQQTLNCDTDFGQPTQPAGCEAASGAIHGTCDAIQNVNNNRLNLGNPAAEYSLETGKGWSVYSYWRLSSNSSGGATVYYSGDTLHNTVGDYIHDMPTKAASTPGTEQFGLGFVPVDDPGDEYIDQHPTVTTLSSKPFATLDTQTPGSGGFSDGQALQLPYNEADGNLDDGAGHMASDDPAKFAFKKSSNTVPEPIAQENTDVISCATAKMRYVGNIAADTPAGVYTTKINYLAAPQY